MRPYRVYVEASGYANAEAEGIRLEGALGDGWETPPTVGIDPDKGMLLVTLTLDAADAPEATGQAMEVWREAWEEAFSELGMPEMMAVRAIPEGVQDEAG
jgi:hypothetical protein